MKRSNMRKTAPICADLLGIPIQPYFFGGERCAYLRDTRAHSATRPPIKTSKNDFFTLPTSCLLPSWLSRLSLIGAYPHFIEPVREKRIDRSTRF
jgi:hypothetical protein